VSPRPPYRKWYWVQYFSNFFQTLDEKNMPMVGTGSTIQTLGTLFKGARRLLFTRKKLSFALLSSKGHVRVSYPLRAWRMEKII
jgi:hypothetical protein